MANETAITPTRQADYPEWYQQVIKAADMAESSPVRGCMVIKPWGYGIWENLQRQLDQRIRDTGHENAYFPLFIPLSFLEKEATHVQGFAKECAVVTHHRLEEKGGKLVPTAPLEEPLIVRPTSETIIGDSFSKWVKSYRDLPLLINQWANVVRWEMRPRLFLRTAEFLWQEGHTVHATEKEAREETMKMLEVYREFAENVLAIPVIAGEKTEGERFPGADNTYCIEAMMQDRKALQAGTSHYLGQNFAKGSDITFTNEQGEIQHAYTTSWGVSTRLIGAMIMTHGDDDGLRVPPKLAPRHVVILPISPKPEQQSAIFAYADSIAASLQSVRYADRTLAVQVDKRDLRGGEKNWQWIKKGIPVRIEVGPRDMESSNVVVYRRDKPHKEKLILKSSEVAEKIAAILEEIQQNYYNEALRTREANIVRNISTFEEFKAFFTPKNQEKPEIHGGFVLAKWCGDSKVEETLKEMKVTIRCMPLEQSGTQGACVITGRPATVDAIFAKAY
ncbi:MAG: proline--tRNA ligase [Deltaproteobacteria bacterium]|nr:proline--tRNA ligase [Deltaproteobacteria bacterium]